MHNQLHCSVSEASTEPSLNEHVFMLRKVHQKYSSGNSTINVEMKPRICEFCTEAEREM